jgi:hypothetical protein
VERLLVLSPIWGKVCYRFEKTPFGWGSVRPDKGGALVAQPVTSILSRQSELAARAQEVTGDANEAGLMVGRVVSQALRTFEAGAAEDIVLQNMRRDLDRMIEQLRSRRRSAIQS